MNKKAIIFMPLFSFFILLILSFAYYQLVIKGIDYHYNLIGENQADIIKSYEKGQEYQINADSSVKYATDIAIYNFTKNSGVAEKCNNTWDFNKDSDCNPDLEKNFINLFNLILNDYGYGSKEVEIKENKLVIQLKNFNYAKQSKNFKLNYTLPSITIKQDLGFDFNKLNSVKENIKKCAKDNQPLDSCIKENKKIEGDIITFTIENNKKITIYTDKPETKKLDFVFKIDIKNTGVPLDKIW